MGQGDQGTSSPCDQLTDVVVKGKVAIYHETKVLYCIFFTVPVDIYPQTSYTLSDKYRVLERRMPA